MSLLTELSIPTTYEAKRYEIASLRRLILRLASHRLFMVGTVPARLLRPVIQRLSDMQCDSDFPRSAFWKREIGHGLQYLLERVSIPPSASRDFMQYFNREIVPLLGPAPQEFAEMGTSPCTFFSDDHTPMELIWAVDADGKMSIRFAMEPLDPVDGTPSPSGEWMKSLHNLRSWHRTKTWSLDWTNVCRETLILDQVEGGEGAEYPSQFFLGV